MAVKFTDKNHSYSSIDETENIKWTSVTTLIHMFKEPFNSAAQAEKSSKGKNPKYNKLSPKEILELWKNENKRAINLGSWYHDQREKDLLACNTITRNGNALTIINPLMDGDIKLAPEHIMSVIITLKAIFFRRLNVILPLKTSDKIAKPSCVLVFTGWPKLKIFSA